MAVTAGRFPLHAGAWASSLALPASKRRRETALLRAQLHLPRGERILLRLGRSTTSTVVATDRALYWRLSSGAWVRRGWEEVERVECDHVNAKVHASGALGHSVTSDDLPIPGDDRLASLVDERIASTRLVRTCITIDRHDVRVEVRRQPATGQLLWLLNLSPGLDPRDPMIHDEIGRALNDLRGALGVGPTS